MPFFRINAFVDEQAAKPLLRGGNPAAVVLLSESQAAALSDPSRQALATELQLSETAFVTGAAGSSEFSLRWFTPVAEVALCGHATLAAAVAVRAAGLAPRNAPISFTTASGTLVVTLGAKASDSPPLQVEFPLLRNHEVLENKEAGELLHALRVHTDSVECVFQSDFDVVIALRDPQHVIDLQPDFERLAAAPGRGAIVAARAAGPEAFVCRFFAPALGIDEDPVTGSAFCALAALYLKKGQRVLAKQVSPRGGILHVERTANDKVLLSGSSHIVIQGSITLPMTSID